MHLPDDLRRRRLWALAASLAGLSLALAACGPASQAPATSEEPIGSEPAASEAAASEPAASEPAASEPTSARCETSADTTGSSTVTISFDSFGEDITISAGDTVAFFNDDPHRHTVTEGSDGVAASEACINASVAANMTVVVAFNEPGDYPITCTVHPTMNFTVHVQ